MLRQICLILLAAAFMAVSLAVGAPQSGNDGPGRYLAGDFHNHTSFSDGATSARTLMEYGVKTYGLDWLAQSGHGGAQARDGRYDDPQYDGAATPPGKYWVESGVVFKGDPVTSRWGRKLMWKWQVIQEFLYPVTWQASKDFVKPIWTGLEWYVPGHEHCSTGILTGQFPPTGERGTATAMAQFTYLYDYKDNDTSEGAGQGWTGKMANIPNGPDAGITMHQKALAAAKWLQQKHSQASYLIPAHIERQGAWNKDKAYGSGWNIEHFRDLNNAAPDVCFGFEGLPGHQANPVRGDFGRKAAGGGTYGGAGYYSATIGNLWDAILGEGRNWWLFANSDWHTRDTKAFKSDFASQESKADFWPGEYQKNYVFVDKAAKPTAHDILKGVQSGNGFIVLGDLIDDLSFTARAEGRTATMGQTLTVAPGEKVTITVKLRDPEGSNHCPYTFPNPSLAQLGIKKPLNRPDLHHVDLITGKIFGKAAPGDPKYTDPTNPTATIKQTVLKRNMEEEGNGVKSFTYTFPATESGYFRLRGTNLPPNTPHETNAQGNPLLDSLAANITYTVNGETRKLDTDVEAWSDLWFYSNPIFLKVATP